MAVILVKPADSDSDAVKALYKQRLDGIRFKISPNLGAPITEEILPDAVLENPVFLRNVEQRILKSLNMSSSDVSALDKDSDRFLDLVELVQINMAIDMIPQVAQVILDAFEGDSVRYATIDFEKRIELLKMESSEKITDIVPDARIETNIASRTLVSRRPY